MTIQTTLRRPHALGPSRRTVSLFGAVSSATILVAIGLVLVGLAAAFPLAISSIEEHRLAVPATDLVIAERIASMWWVLVVAAVVHFVAGFAAPDGGMLGKGVALLVTGIGASLGAAVAMALQMNGPMAMTAAVVAGFYAIALLGTSVVQRRTN